MTKRRVSLFVGFVALIGIVLSVMAMLPPTSGATKANFDRIDKGMPKIQVEEILGRDFIVQAKGVTYKPDVAARRWNGIDGTAHVDFVDECVLDTEWVSHEESMIDKLRRWFHLQ